MKIEDVLSALVVYVMDGDLGLIWMQKREVFWFLQGNDQQAQNIEDEYLTNIAVFLCDFGDYLY